MLCQFYRFLDPVTLQVQWDPPADEGARSDTTYKVDCDLCGSAVTFDPPSPSAPAVPAARQDHSSTRPSS